MMQDASSVFSKKFLTASVVESLEPVVSSANGDHRYIQARRNTVRLECRIVRKNGIKKIIIQWFWIYLRIKLSTINFLIRILPSSITMFLYSVIPSLPWPRRMLFFVLVGYLLFFSLALCHPSLLDMCSFHNPRMNICNNRINDVEQIKN